MRVCMKGYVRIPAKIMRMGALALMVAGVFYYLMHTGLYNPFCTPVSSLELGIDTINRDFFYRIVPTKGHTIKVGLVTNQSGITRGGKSNIQVLQEYGLEVKKIFTPEHGGITNELLQLHSPIEVIPLHDGQRHRSFDEAMYKDIDIIVFDIQDVGMRHYSYLTTLYYLLESAQRYKKTVVVCDRPNVLGAGIEGVCTTELITPENLPIPTRYGMTIGELAHYINTYVLAVPARLFVAPMNNYQRDTYILPAGVSLSPNIHNMDSCYGYSFLGLLGEVAPFDTAVGTSDAFQCILLPETLAFKRVYWHQLKEILAKLGIDSSLYRYFSERKKQYYTGLRVRVRSLKSFSSLQTLLTILRFFKNHGVLLAFSPRFDTAVGSSLIREVIEGKKDLQQLEHHVNRSLKHFYNRARQCFLYKPLPQVVMV